MPLQRLSRLFFFCPSAPVTAFAVILAVALAAGPLLAEETLFDALRYRHVGPIGNRVIAVAGEPGNPNIYYAGAASGGVWRTTDGGAHWHPTFDDQPASSIGALAVAPSDPNVVWVGTGETFIRANISIGNGVYRSTDRGRTWTHLGLDKTGRIGRIVVHPNDPDVAWVAALGHVYGPQQERGVYRTTDGGETWEQVLFVDENTGASDLVIDPTNPRRLFAGMWEIEVKTWKRRSGGPGSGLWTSSDGGTTWTELRPEDNAGLPSKPWGKIGLTLSADDPERVYALIETSSNRDFSPVDEFEGVLWRSSNGGETWQMVSADNNLAQRPLYYSRALAAPDDANEVYFMAVRHMTSLDGGQNAFRTPDQPGWDHHDMWVDPENPDRMIVGHDGGVSISVNRGKSWLRPTLPIAQMYHVDVDDAVPYNLYGNRQDGSTYYGPSRTLSNGAIPINAWSPVGGCETGFSIPDPVETHIVWSGCYDGILGRYDLRNGHEQDVSVWPDKIESWPSGEAKFRFQWTFPIAISPHDHKRVYVGSQFVHATTDRGNSWQVISPDLTTDDPELQKRTGGLTLDDASPTYAPTIFALAESPLEEGLIWAGTNDGLVQRTRDGGETWQNVTAGLPDLPELGTVSNIEPSRHEAGRAYLTVDRHQLGDTDPYIYKTEDYGETWTSIASDLPRTTFSYAHCVREDPKRPGLLYLGTENGVWVSFNDGANWRSLQSNLPHAPVHWLVVQDRFSDLVVATYGRGFWVLDDISPLREFADQENESEAFLFEPQPAYRFRNRQAVNRPEEGAQGENPPYGVPLHYHLPERAEAEEGEDESEPTEITLEILRDGETVAELDAGTEPGLHRVYWNLRYESGTRVKLRTKPEENPHITVPDKGWREIGDLRRGNILAPPGNYTVRLGVGDQVQTRTLEVLRDPRSEGTEEDIAAQMELVLALDDMLEQSAVMINEIEWLRFQLENFQARLSSLENGDESSEIDEAATALDEKLRAFEGNFFDLRLTGAGQDGLRWRPRIFSKMATLMRSVGSSDYRPTTQQREVFEMYRDEFDVLVESFKALRSEELAPFNAMLAERGIAHLIVDSAALE